MTKEEIIEYLYENNVRGDLTIEQMAEDIADASQKEYKRGRLDALNELKAYIREMGAYDTADTPQTKRIKTPDYCDICNHNGCDNCIANNLDEYCVPSGYAPKDTPQTDCDKCIWSVCNYNKVDWDADTPQTDCAWMYDSRRDYEYDKALDEMERNE